MLISKINKNNSDYSNIPGLWYKNEGVVHNNKMADMFENLDQKCPISLGTFRYDKV